MRGRYEVPRQKACTAREKHMLNNWTDSTGMSDTTESVMLRVDLFLKMSGATLLKDLDWQLPCLGMTGRPAGLQPGEGTKRGARLMHVLLPRSARGKDPCREACVAAQDTAITGRKSHESQARVSIIPANSRTKVSGSSFSQWCTGLRGKPSSQRHLQIYNGLRGDPAIASSSRGHSWSPSSHELESQHLSTSPAALYNRRVSAADVGILQIWMIVGIASVVCGFSPVLDTSMRTTVMPCPCTAKKARSKQGWAHRPRRRLVEHTLHCISPRFAGRKVENNSRQKDL